MLIGEPSDLIFSAMIFPGTNAFHQQTGSKLLAGSSRALRVTSIRPLGGRSFVVPSPVLRCPTEKTTEESLKTAMAHETDEW